MMIKRSELSAVLQQLSRGIQCTTLCSLLLLWNAVATAREQLPNIVLFLVDDMGVMDTSVPSLTDAAGAPVRYPLNDLYRTPYMEQLASRGIRFSQFYAMSVCSPTRVSLMTGQNAARHHVTNWINPDTNNAGTQGPPDWNWTGLTDRDLTLPRLLQQRGYRTVHLGKGHFGAAGTVGEDPAHLGFQVNIGGAAFGQPGSYYGKDNYSRRPGNNPRQPTHAVPHLEKYHGTDTFLTDALTLEANAQMEAAVKAGEPFFVYLAHYAVHSPFQSDPRFAADYAAAGLSPQAQAFATLIAGMDRSLGSILAKLDQLQIARDTLVIFLGDNGSDAPLGHEHAVACAAPLRGKKGAHYEGGMRVPCIIAWAQPDPQHPRQQEWLIPADRVQTQMANITDLFPTLVELAGLEVPADYPVDGQSLKRLLSGQADPQHRAEFLMHYPHGVHRSSYFTSYRRGDWKVIYHYVPGPQSEGNRYQLFNLAADPFEQQDLAATHPGELRALLTGMQAELERLGAQYPVSAESGERLLPQLP
jgi:arylsulfatase A-like enzyme